MHVTRVAVVALRHIWPEILSSPLPDEEAAAKSDGRERSPREETHKKVAHIGIDRSIVYLIAPPKPPDMLTNNILLNEGVLLLVAFAVLGDNDMPRGGNKKQKHKPQQRL